MSGRIVIRGLRASGRHGALPGERDHAQAFEVDLDVVADLSKAAASDDLSDTLDYGVIAAEVRTIVSDTSFALIESLADAIARHLVASGAGTATVRVAKPGAAAALDVASVAVEVSRSAGPADGGTGDDGTAGGAD